MPGLAKSQTAGGTLRVLAALLSYPDAGMRRHLSEMREILRGESVLLDARRPEHHAEI